MNHSESPKIGPSERYNQHEKKKDFSKEFLREALVLCNLNPDSILEKLSGGFQNANYLVKGHETLVFRVYTLGSESANREIGVLNFLKDRKINVPIIHGVNELNGNTVVVMSFIEGILFQDYLQQTHQPDLDIFFQIGQELAKIHSVKLPRPGFLGAEMKIGTEYENFSIFIRGYIENVLSKVSRDRLDQSIVDRLMKLVQNEWHYVLETEPSHTLVHCDFNPKNILIHKDGRSVSGVLDWEFALSGNGYIDIGNFFRFPDYPSGSDEIFIRGYESARGPVHPEWKKISKLLDLGNICSFLDQNEDYQKTFRTARSVIADTLSYFNY